MEATTVTSKGQVTIPKELRQHLGIHNGSRIVFVAKGDHAELRVDRKVRVDRALNSGFGMVKVDRKSVPADFDPASLLKP